MKSLVQLVHTLNYGDAISGEAVAIRRLAAKGGFDSKILSVHAHHLVSGECSLLGDRTADKTEPNGRLLLLHYSIASPLNDLYLRSENDFRAVIYHNLTPERFYLSYNARVTADLRRAKDDLTRVIEASDLVIADSAYNAGELTALGARSVQVLPLFLDQKKWSVGANGGIASLLRSGGGANILHVGRLAPNKAIEDILKPFYFYRHKIDKKARLWLIGSDIDNEIYSFELRRLVSELQLQDSVNFVGAVADSELRAFYENCSAYLAMSEHEGFCVPLIEAMHFGLPVIAFGSTAVPETLGDGGILLQDKDPASVAELLHLVITDGELRSSLQERGRKRAAEYSEERFIPQLDRVVFQPFSSHVQSNPREYLSGGAAPFSGTGDATRRN